MEKKVIYLAGGCFWGVEAYFKQLDGVIDTEVGYANGKEGETDYDKVNETGHAETLKLTYDPQILPLRKVLSYYYYIINPFTINRQGNDRGSQYRTGIFTVDEEDKKMAQEFLWEKQEKEEEKIQVLVEDLKNFIKAEDYHQDFLDKNPSGYCHVNLNDVPEF